VENTNKQLVAYLGPHEPKHHKLWNEYGAQYQRQQKWRLAIDASTALRFTTDTFFKPVRIDLVNKQTKELLSISHNGSLQQVKEQPHPGKRQPLNKHYMWKEDSISLTKHIMNCPWFIRSFLAGTQLTRKQNDSTLSVTFFSYSWTSDGATTVSKKVAYCMARTLSAILPIYKGRIMYTNKNN